MVNLVHCMVLFSRSLFHGHANGHIQLRHTAMPSSQPETPHPTPRLQWHTMANHSLQLPGHEHRALNIVQVLYASDSSRQAGNCVCIRNKLPEHKNISARPSFYKGPFYNCADHTEKLTHADNHNRNQSALRVLDIEQSQATSAEHGEVWTSWKQ